MPEPGATIFLREVLGDRAWLRLPLHVDSDYVYLLAFVLEDGAPFTFDDE